MKHLKYPYLEKRNNLLLRKWNKFTIKGVFKSKLITFWRILEVIFNHKRMAFEGMILFITENRTGFSILLSKNWFSQKKSHSGRLELIFNDFCIWTAYFLNISEFVFNRKPSKILDMHIFMLENWIVFLLLLLLYLVKFLYFSEKASKWMLEPNFGEKRRNSHTPGSLFAEISVPLYRQKNGKHPFMYFHFDRHVRNIYLFSWKFKLSVCVRKFCFSQRAFEKCLKVKKKTK